MENNGIKKYDLVLFDLDGTILNTLEDLKDALNHSLSKYGYPERSLNEVRQFIGNGIKKLIERALPSDISIIEIEKIFQEFLIYYKEHCHDKTKPYDGVLELIQSLKKKGYHTAVISNKTDDMVQKLCEIYFPNLFDYVLGERSDIKKKPSPDSVFLIMEKFNAKKAMYIGDSEVDIEVAKNASIDCAIVTWGFRDKDYLIKHGANLLVDHVKDILNLL